LIAQQQAGVSPFQPARSCPSSAAHETLASAQSADLREKLAVEAIEPLVMSPECATFIQTDIVR
jgi:hypothetical protein